MSGSSTHYADEAHRAHADAQIAQVGKKLERQLLGELTDVRAQLALSDDRLVVIMAGRLPLVDLAGRLAPAMHYLVIDIEALKVYGWARPGVGFEVLPQAMRDAEAEGGVRRLIERLVSTYAQVLASAGIGYQMATLVFLIGLDRVLELPGCAARNIAELAQVDMQPISRVVVLLKSETARLALDAQMQLAPGAADVASGR